MDIRLSELEEEFLRALRIFIDRDWNRRNLNINLNYNVLNNSIRNIRGGLNKNKREKYDEIMGLISRNLNNPTPELKNQIKILIDKIQSTDLKTIIVNKSEKKFSPFKFLFRKENKQN